MALYDDAKLIFLASAAAGLETKDASKVYNVKPDGSLGSELIINGTFDSDSDWTKGTGFSISGGVASCDGSQSSTTNLHNAAFNNLVNGKTYRVEYTITSYTAGSVTVKAGNTGVGTARSAAGTYVEHLVAEVSTFPTVQFNADADFVGSIDNVSCKEMDVADFTISRTDNLNQTRVGPTGLIEKGRENLLLQSNQFDTTWSAVNATVTGGQEGYDGSSDAWELKMTGSQDGDNEARIRQTGISVSGVCTYSVFAKAGNVNFVRIIGVVDGTTNPIAFFDLSGNGSVTSSTSSVAATSIESFGNGWFRVSFTHKGAANPITDVRINISDGDDDVYVPTGSFIYIQDSQLEAGLVATDVITAGAATATAGIKEDEPRFDYPIAGGAPSLLIEPQRINKVPHSEYFGGWSASNLTVTNNDIITPEGVKNGAKLLASGSGTVNHQIDTPSFNVTSGAVTASIFAKKGNTDFVRLRLNGTSSEIRAWFNLSSGAVGTVDTGGTGTITDMGDGWHKCTVTEAGNTNTTGMSLQVFVNESDGQTSWVADGDEFIYIYGAQFEEGANATSYIPTHGAAATRSPDTIAALTSIPSVNTSTYTFFAHVSQANTGGTGNRGPRMQNASNDSLMGYFINSSDQKQFFLDPDSAGGGSNRTFSTTDISPASSTQLAGDEVKYAFVINGTSVKCFVDGNTLFDGTASGVVTANRIIFATSDGTPDHIKSVIYFPSAISNLDAMVITDTNYGSYSEMVNSLSYNSHG